MITSEEGCRMITREEFYSKITGPYPEPDSIGKPDSIIIENGIRYTYGYDGFGSYLKSKERV